MVPPIHPTLPVQSTDIFPAGRRLSSAKEGPGTPLSYPQRDTRGPLGLPVWRPVEPRHRRGPRQKGCEVAKHELHLRAVSPSRWWPSDVNTTALLCLSDSRGKVYRPHSGQRRCKYRHPTPLAPPFPTACSQFVPRSATRDINPLSWAPLHLPFGA